MTTTEDRDRSLALRLASALNHAEAVGTVIDNMTSFVCKTSKDAALDWGRLMRTERKRAKRTTYIADMLNEPSSPDSVREESETNDLKAHLIDSLDDEVNRRILQCRVVGMSEHEIAQVVGLTQQSISARLARIREYLSER